MMTALMHIFSLYFSSENNWITKQLANSMRSNSELSRPHPSAFPTIFSWVKRSPEPLYIERGNRYNERFSLPP